MFTTSHATSCRMNFIYCRVNQDGTVASGPRGGISFARDFLRAGFRKFSGKNSCIARARRGRAGWTVYPPRIQIADVAAPIARPDHRQSKFGLRHAIKLNQERQHPQFCSAQLVSIHTTSIRQLASWTERACVWFVNMRACERACARTIALDMN
jgi:hypothetical protein